MKYGNVVLILSYLAGTALVATGCCGSSSEVSETTSVVPAEPNAPAPDPVAPAPPTPGAAQPTAGSSRTLILGSWRGQAHGDTARQIEMLELALQETDPTPEQLARFTEGERNEIGQSRQELSGSGAEAQLARALMGAMVEVMRNIQVTATAEQLTISHGIGDAEDQPRAYTVLGEQGGVLSVQVAPPAGEGGGPETASFTFGADGSMIMQIINEDGESTYYRLTRGESATPQP